MIRKIIRGVIWGTILSFVYLVGCSNTPADKEIKPFVDSFEKDIGVSTKGVTIYFSKLKGTTVGVCYPGIKIIRLDEDFVKNSNLTMVKALVYHELGHCVCNILQHTEESEFCSSSIMTPTMQSYWCYSTRWGKYIKDLRKRCK